MALHLGDAFGIVGVHFVRLRPFFFGVDELCDHLAVFHEQVAQLFAHVGVVGDDFGDDVFGACDGIFGGRNALFFIDIFGGFGVHVERLILREDGLRQGLQAALDGDARARLLFLFIRAVDIFRLGQRRRGGERGGDLVRHFALLGDGLGDLFFALFQAAQIGEAVVELAQHLVVAAARHLFAVARDERNGVALVDEVDDVFCPVRTDGRKFLRQFL